MTRPAAPELLEAASRELRRIRDDNLRIEEPDFHTMTGAIEELERRLSLAQTEIKGHMRVKDDLEKRFVAHTKAVEEFLNALYAIMVDPCAEGVIKVDEMKALLISAAIRDREAQARIAELEKLFIGWDGYCWKDGKYIDDVQEFFDAALKPRA